MPRFPQSATQRQRDAVLVCLAVYLALAVGCSAAENGGSGGHGSPEMSSAGAASTGGLRGSTGGSTGQSGNAGGGASGNGNSAGRGGASMRGNPGDGGHGGAIPAQGGSPNAGAGPGGGSNGGAAMGGSASVGGAGGSGGGNAALSTGCGKAPTLKSGTLTIQSGGATEAVGGIWATSDVSYVNDVLDQVQRDLCIDTERIGLEGFSQGAAMVWTVACSRSKTFRFAIGHSGGGLANPKTCESIAYLGLLGLQESTGGGGQTIQTN